MKCSIYKILSNKAHLTLSTHKPDIVSHGLLYYDTYFELLKILQHKSDIWAEDYFTIHH